MKKSTLSGSALTLVAMLALAGCGGGGSGGGGTTNSGTGQGQGQAQIANEVPESAGTSSSAFIAFLKTLMTNDETSEPMKIREGWAVPADDTGDPAPMG